MWWACEQHAQPRNLFLNTICRPLAIVVSDPSYLGRCSGCVLSHTHFSTSLVSSYIHIYAVMHRLEICPPAIVVNVMCRVVISGCLLSVWHSFAHMHRHLCDTHFCQFICTDLKSVHCRPPAIVVGVLGRVLLTSVESGGRSLLCPRLSPASPCYAHLLHLFILLS